MKTQFLKLPSIIDVTNKAYTQIIEIEKLLISELQALTIDLGIESNHPFISVEQREWSSWLWIDKATSIGISLDGEQPTHYLAFQISLKGAGEPLHEHACYPLVVSAKRTPPSNCLLVSL